MPKIDFDFLDLEKKLNQPKFYKLADVQDKLQKVAFDVVRFIDGQDIEGLWQIKQTEGGEYIVAMYEDSLDAKVATDWSAYPDKTASNVSVFYKNTPVARISLAQLGIPVEDRSGMAAGLPRKLASNAKLVAGLLQQVPAEDRVQLLQTYPELNS